MPPCLCDWINLTAIFRRYVDCMVTVLGKPLCHLSVAYVHRSYK
jgi:hypothetical protein